MPLKITVPYNQKDNAKLKGAFWDNVEKTWFIPNHKKLDDFNEWMDTEKFSMIAKAPFYIGINKKHCWKCFEPTTVVALASNHFYIFDYPDDEDVKSWIKQDYFSFFNMPGYIEDEVAQLIQSKYPFYKLGFSKTVNGKYWANHCERCNALQGDFFMHEEPGGEFYPVEIEECKKIILKEVPYKFDLKIDASTSWSSNESQIWRFSQKKSWE